MKKIKFRAKKYYGNHEYIYGYYIYYPDTKCHYINEWVEKEKRFKTMRIIPESLQQYICKVNSKEIYK